MSKACLLPLPVFMFFVTLYPFLASTSSMIPNSISAWRFVWWETASADATRNQSRWPKGWRKCNRHMQRELRKQRRISGFGEKRETGKEQMVLPSGVKAVPNFVNHGAWPHGPPANYQSNAATYQALMIWSSPVKVFLNLSISDGRNMGLLCNEGPSNFSLTIWNWMD